MPPSASPGAPGPWAGERSWSHRGAIGEPSGRAGDQSEGVVGSGLTDPPRARPPRAGSLVVFTHGCEAIERVIGPHAFGIPPAEASRDGRLDGAHALLPAGIFSSTVQLGAPRRAITRQRHFGSSEQCLPECTPRRPSTAGPLVARGSRISSTRTWDLRTIPATVRWH
jgi:hypothetical protein